ncbi:MAG: amidohydrolase family protein, partial [Phycisphaerae bacterium]|nr:amidohydrolase family protein [Phycisphaerae bacterium]
RLALLAARVRGSIGKTAADAGKYEDGERGFFPANDAFRLATVGGASVLCRDELGHLAPGAAADFAMFRTDDIALAGAVAQDPVAALMLCDPPRADRVYVAGREVIHDGRIAALDENKLAADFNELVTRRFRRPS